MSLKKFSITHRALAVFTAVICLSSLSLPVRADERSENLRIGVRSSADASWSRAKGKAAAEKTHGQTWGLFFVTLVPNQDNALIQPVNAQAIADELEHQLGLQGFTKAKPKTKPEILISAEYGRGWLPNPYDVGTAIAGNQGLGGMTGGVPTSSVSDPSSAIHHTDKDWLEKRQNDSLEKLYIRVRAWTYPKNSGEKPKAIWTTYMVIDDPDHRDLNNIYKDLLAAGANYFGHPLDDPNNPETTVLKPIANGQVDVGNATVIDKK